MGFGALRVINDDSIAPSKGFGTHPHRDMEIITIPLKGVLGHKDSVGNAALIKKGEVQIMSAGTGITHSEVNASTTETTKLLQIWVMPKLIGVKPRYEQKFFSQEGRKNNTQLVVASDGRLGALSINQDAYFSLCDLDSGKSVTYKKQSEGNGVYVFVIEGEVQVGGETLRARDGMGIHEFDSLQIIGNKDSEILLMEVPV